LTKAGLILAAGAGKRFGLEPKLLADLRGRPLLEHAIGAACAVAELERIVVVLGANAEQITGAVDFACAEPVICECWDDGLSASLRCGLDALPGCDRVIVILGDEPLITPELIARFVHAPPGTRATYGGRPGHPVVLGPEQIRTIQSLTGDRGARDLLADGPTMECGDHETGRDVDTAADLEAVRRRASAESMDDRSSRPRRSVSAEPPSPAR
jgi:CTP:molybdopterin cytidylyltransferase MocA